MTSKLELSSSQNLQEVLDRASSFLSEHDQEEYIAFWLMRERFDLSRTDIVLDKRRLSESELDQLSKDLFAVASDYPPQYQVGHTWFYGRKFSVDERVLIPRPETEEMVAQVLKDHGDSHLSVLDIGTGSGAIAVTLKAERPQFKVTGTDLSPSALEIAQKNAQMNQVEIEWLQGDLLQPVEGRQFDLIVSNPPYIAEKERELMGASVLKHEPQMALFADEGGLAVYYALVASLSDYLTNRGQVYLEIGYKQGKAVKDVIQATFPQGDVQVITDMRGQDRLVHLRL